MLITPLFTLWPVAMAVAAAAESVMGELADYVVTSAWCRKPSNANMPGAP
jgi:hypothetical protein